MGWAVCRKWHTCHQQKEGYHMEKNEQLRSLTATERKLAEENHNLIYTFLTKGKYNTEDYYNIVVFGYLKGIQVYCRRADLQEKYKLSVIVWNYMKAEIGNHFKRENAQKRATKETILSLYTEGTETESLYNLIGGKSAESDVLESIFAEGILKNLTETQRKIICIKAEGYNNTEACKLLEMASSTLYKEINRIKRILENLEQTEV